MKTMEQGLDGTGRGPRSFGRLRLELLKSVFEFLMHVESSRKAVDTAVSALAEAGVIHPWQIKLKTEKGEQDISGLHTVDEAALAALPDDAFLKLRKVSALTVAHAQMLSMGNLSIFETLGKLNNPVAPPQAVAVPDTIDGLFGMASDDTIKFS